MKLTDREILELNELCGAVVDATLTDAQRARLTAILRESEAARRFYVRAVGQSASLHHYAAEMHAEAPDRPRVAPVIHMSWWIGAGLAAAAAIAVIWWRRDDSGGTRHRPDDFVATVTATHSARWNGQNQPAGSHLRKGQKLALASGLAEITFDSGARVLIDGGAALDLNSAWDVTLRRGTLRATVPPQAVGFRVANSAVEVVDLGTEFTMQVDAHGGADVFVLKGEVEAAPRSSSEETVLLREREARRFDLNGISDVADREQKFAQFMQPPVLERFAPKARFLQWAFDETEGTLAAARTIDFEGPASDSALSLYDANDERAARVEGRRGRALHFDGHMYGKAHVPGLSGTTAHTISFWVKVPEDAQPIDTWMAAWGSTVPKLGGRPVQISWNRRPGEGALGALRTDFGGGFAVGTTTLRDGKWHHVAVYFAPGDATDPAPEVKQYVDGRLESSTIVPGIIHASATTGEMAQADALWLGYRLTGKQEGRRFRGEIDELFIADRGLEPGEIVALMRDNQLPPTTVATR